MTYTPFYVYSYDRRILMAATAKKTKEKVTSTKTKEKIKVSEDQIKPEKEEKKIATTENIEEDAGNTEKNEEKNSEEGKEEKVSSEDNKVDKVEQKEDEEKVPNKYDEDDGFSLKKMLLWIWGVLMVAGIVTALLFAAYNKGLSDGENKTKLQLSLNPTPTEEPSPTQAPVDEEYIIKVLNGSGISGEAARTQSLLEDANYSVSEIGNADLSTYEKTIIQTKSSVSQSFISSLKDTLSEEFEVGETEELDEDEDLDIIIIVGSGKSEEL